MQVEEAETEEQMKRVLDSDDFDFRFEVGIGDNLKDRKSIVQSVANYFTVIRVKAQIDQICEGLSCLGVDELMKSYPSTMHRLFTSQPQPLTPYSVFDMFHAKLSSEGSNQREDQDQVLMYWSHFLELVGCKFALCVYPIPDTHSSHLNADQVT